VTLWSDPDILISITESGSDIPSLKLSEWWGTW
jgi:hypothetical protein